MLTMFLSGVVLWGSAFSPLTDAFSVVSMAAMVEFAHRFPQNATSLASRLVRAIAWGAGLVALAMGCGYAFQILALHQFTAALPSFYAYFNPLSFLIALGVSISRTIAIQGERSPGVLGALRSFIHPQSRPARLLRNFSLALSIGLVQGYVSGVGLPASFPTALGPTLIILSLLLMLAAVVYATFDFPAQQPSLVVRLVGLTLVTTLAILGIVALDNTNLLDGWIVERTVSQAEDARRALQAGLPQDMPAEALYVLSWPEAGQGMQPGRLVFARQPGFDPRPLLQEAAIPQIPPVWGYIIAGPLLSNAAARGEEIRLRYGDRQPGSYYQYAGYTFGLDGTQYEVGFSLAEMSRASQRQGMGMIGCILASAFFIIYIFPLFFRSNLVRPLDRLLAGIRQVDAGDLDVRVPVTHNDEVGYLTAAFNKMAGSLKRELDGRQSAEAELRQLNLTLEARVAERTRELEALYDVTAASSQAGDPETLLAVLLERSLAALRTPVGFILLFQEQAGARRLALAARQNLPPDWLPNLSAVSPDEAWISTAVGQDEPLLIADTQADARAPAFMRSAPPSALILAPLPAEGQVLGILGMARPAEEKFDLDEVALLVSIVNQVGVAVHTETLRQIVQQASVLEERQRLARDLHDSVTQSLYGLVTLTEVGLMRVEAGDLPASAGLYRKIGQSARQAIREMRLFIHQLRPPVLKEEGLAGALDLRLAAVEGRSDVHARLVADEDIRLPLPVETALYHIAQEALNNALKHARAATVTVTLARQAPQGVMLSVVDDGCGFDPLVTRAGMGLGNMQTRAAEIGARLEISSQPGQGTRISVCLESPK
jgi:signal transduction histidine kinase/HAMP domain-containing protein